MEINVVIQTEPLSFCAEPATGCGAVVRFEGRVRGEENGRPIAALKYEAYEPMATRQMEKILGGLAMEHPCQRAWVRHRIGTIPVDEAAILIEVRAAHRAEAFALTATFMDLLKKDVPIWKVGVVEKAS